MDGLLAAIGFLTTVPTRGSQQHAFEGSQVRWFVPVGVVVGGALALISAVAYRVWGQTVGAAVVLVAWVALTGALHLDGLADSADAALAPVTRERRLEILRDVHHGTFGIAAIVLVIVLKWATLTAMSGTQAAAAVLVACVAGRAALSPILAMYRSPRPGGMADSLRGGATTVNSAVGIAIALAMGVVAYGIAGIAIACATVVLAILAAKWLATRFGGISGDSCGAIVELGEAIALLAITATLHQGWAHAFPYGVSR